MKWLRDLWRLVQNDPVRKCEVYKSEGCAHVDGMLCDFPECSILKEYRKVLNSK